MFTIDGSSLVVNEKVQYKHVTHLVDPPERVTFLIVHDTTFHISQLLFNDKGH